MRDENSLMHPPLEKLLEKIPGKYALVLTATKRAKQIILQHRLNPGLADDGQTVRKPLSIALNDISEGSVDQSTLQTTDVFLEEYVEEEQPAYPDIEIPSDEAATTEPEAEAQAEEVEDDYDDLSDVEDVLDLDMFTDSKED